MLWVQISPGDFDLKNSNYKGETMKFIKNTDSFVFAIRKFTNIKTKKTWWLVNLVWYTIVIGNFGENK